jgi:hypothetical protein
MCRVTVNANSPCFLIETLGERFNLPFFLFALARLFGLGLGDLHADELDGPVSPSPLTRLSGPEEYLLEAMENARVVLLTTWIGGPADRDGLPLDAGLFHRHALGRHLEVLFAEAGAALRLIIPEQVEDLSGHFLLRAEPSQVGLNPG